VLGVNMHAGAMSHTVIYVAMNQDLQMLCVIKCPTNAACESQCVLLEY